MGNKWKSIPLIDAPLEILDGDRGKNYPSRQDQFDKGFCLFLNAGNVTNEGFDFSNYAFITKGRDELLRQGKLKRNDIVITTRGTVGNVAYYDSKIPYEHIRINSGMVIIRTKADYLDSRFAYYFLKSKLFSDQVQMFRTGSAQPQLPIKDINQIVIPLPPLPTQERIADILGTLDDKIELNRQMNRTLEAMARAIFKSWFVDFDPIYAKMEGRDDPLPAEVLDLFPDELVESELGLIPKGWEVGKVGDVAVNRTDVVRPDEVDEKTFYIGLEHMPRRDIALDSWDYSEKVTSNKYAFRQGSILFGKLRPYFHKVGVTPIDGICSTDILVINGKSDIYQYFLLFLLSSKVFVDNVSAASTGTKMPRTNWKYMESHEIPLPQKSLLDEFNAIVTPMVEKIILNIHESRNLVSLRDVLLPKLMSGEIGI